MFRTLLSSLGWLTAGLSSLATAFAVGGPRGGEARVPTAPAPRAASAEENPTVRPGLIAWHGSLADAQAAAEKSGRPVLVFHMMGRLDKQFC